MRVKPKPGSHIPCGLAAGLFFGGESITCKFLHFPGAEAPSAPKHRTSRKHQAPRSIKRLRNIKHPAAPNATETLDRSKSKIYNKNYE